MMWHTLRLPSVTVVLHEMPVADSPRAERPVKESLGHKPAKSKPPSAAGAVLPIIPVIPDVGRAVLARCRASAACRDGALYAAAVPCPKAAGERPACPAAPLASRAGRGPRPSLRNAGHNSGALSRRYCQRK